MKFKSVKVTGKKKIEIVENSIDNIQDDEVLIKVISCGICSTERAVYEGTTIGVEGVSFHYKEYPADLGHEAVGEVIETGKKIHHLKKGDIVSGMTYQSSCFSEFICEKEIDLIKLPEKLEINPKYMVLEPVVGTVNILHQLNIRIGDDVCVIGDGFMSLVLIECLSKYPLNSITVVGHHDYRLELAKKRGATKIINSKNEENLKSILFNETKNKGFDIVVEYAGSTNAMALAASVTKPKCRSQLVLASAYSNDTPFIISNYLQNRAPIIVPAYPHQSKNKILDLERSIWTIQNINYRDLITHEYDFKNIFDCFDDQSKKKNNFIKGIFLPN